MSSTPAVPALSTFDFNSNKLRVVVIGDTPLFVAADACRVLELGSQNGGYGHHLKRLAADKVTSMSDMGVKLGGTGMGHARLISESGLYKLVMRSDKPEARAFQDWVTREVLPAIRKDGGYILGEEKVKTGEMSEDELVLRATNLEHERQSLPCRSQQSLPLSARPILH